MPRDAQNPHLGQCCRGWAALHEGERAAGNPRKGGVGQGGLAPPAAA